MSSLLHLSRLRALTLLFTAIVSLTAAPALAARCLTCDGDDPPPPPPSNPNPPTPQPPAPPAGPPGYPLDTNDADAYQGKNEHSEIGTMRQALENPSSGQVTLFDYAKEDDFGNPRWGAGYHLRSKLTATREAAAAKTNLDASGDAWGRVFGNTFTAVNVVVNGHTTHGEQVRESAFTYAIYVFGNKVREDTVDSYQISRSISLPLGGNFPFDATQAVTPEFGATFMVGPIPVSVGAQVFAREYVKLAGDFNTWELKGQMVPGALAFVQAKAGVGLPFFGVGVKGSLTLLSLSLPVEVGMGWQWQPVTDSTCNATLVANANAKLVAGSLSGTLSAYVAYIFGESSVDIARWNGVTKTWPIAEISKEWSLGEGSCAGYIPPPPA